MEVLVHFVKGLSNEMGWLAQWVKFPSRAASPPPMTCYAFSAGLNPFSTQIQNQVQVEKVFHNSCLARMLMFILSE